MRFLPTVALLSLLASPAAFAGTINFGSTVGTVSYTNASGSGQAVQYTGTTPYSIGNYVAAVPGTVYLTYDDSTEYLPSGLTTYTTTFNGAPGETGSLKFTADDAVDVYLNGVLIGSSATFNSLTSASFTPIAGTNTLSFVVDNLPQPPNAANPTALDFAGSVATPEPSSIFLLGTGILGLAGAARRKLFA